MFGHICQQRSLSYRWPCIFGWLPCYYLFVLQQVNCCYDFFYRAIWKTKLSWTPVAVLAAVGEWLCPSVWVTSVYSAHCTFGPADCVSVHEWESPGVWCGWQSPPFPPLWLQISDQGLCSSAGLRWPPWRRSAAKPNSLVLFSHVTWVTWPSMGSQWCCCPCLFMWWKNIPTAGPRQLQKHLQPQPLVRIPPPPTASKCNLMIIKSVDKGVKNLFSLSL